MLEALNNLPLPLIGRQHGGVFGGGIGLACVCDVVLAAPSLPTSGRSSKLDRAVLTALVQAWQVRGGQGDQP